MTSRELGLSPALPPKFSVSLPSGRVTSDPKAIRAAIALMNQNAIIGGAAAHWGGPSAFCEINSILFSIFFEKEKSDNCSPYRHCKEYAARGGHRHVFNATPHSLNAKKAN